MEAPVRRPDDRTNSQPREALGAVSLLARAGELLSASRSRDEALDRLARLLVPALATWCAIDVAEDDGTMRRCAVAQADGRSGFPLSPHTPHGAAVVMRTGEPDLVPRITDEHLRTAAHGDPERLAALRALGLVSSMCVPISARDRQLGAITLLSTDAEHPYGGAELELAAQIGRRAAEALEAAQLQRSLEHSEARYGALFEQSPLPMWVYDAGTLEFLAVNDAAVRHYGYSREEFLQMRIVDIRPAEEVPALLGNLRREGPGSPIPQTWKHRKKDGTLIDVEISAGRVVFDGRDAALILAHDVSERRRLQQRLIEAERMEAIGRLAGGVAHDFNNLLTVIHGYASVLLGRGDDGDREELREIVHAAEQASALTRQMLAFSRRQVMHAKVLDLNEIVAQMQSMLQRIIGDDISVGVRFAQGLAAVEADRAQLERVILNLAANARDAMPDGGRLTIETANVDLDEEYVAGHGEGTPGPHVMLAVSDTGAGMSDEVRRHLFEPFFTTKAHGGGTGLGLATVFGVVKQSGGSIYVYSEEGAGTTFKIYLPAAHGAVVPDGGAPAAEPVGGHGSETILVVEDDERVRDLVRIMLEGAGYDVLVAGDAAEAERIVTASAVDLVVTDVVMPDVSGQALAERLADVAPATRILFMSGYSDEAVYHHGIIRPDAAFIEKPFSARVLARKVRETLDGAPA
jgi:two-component system, cell cycle sensor histidine kinase and response regulator CckA